VASGVGAYFVSLLLLGLRLDQFRMSRR
jgi:hypothetical protein